MMSRRAPLPFTVAVSLILVVVTLAGGAAAAPGGAERIKIAIASAKTPADLPTLIAQERGFFDSHGLRVEVARLETGRESLRALTKGRADYALTSLTAFLLHHFGSAPKTPNQPGDDLVILAALADRNELVRIVVSAGSDVFSATAERPFQIGYEPDSSAEYLWWLFRQFHRVDPPLFQPHALGPEAIVAALHNGHIDGAALSNGQIIELLSRSGPDKKWRILSSSAFYTGKWLLVTTRQRTRQQPQNCARLLSAYEQAIEFINDPTRVIETQHLPDWTRFPSVDEPGHTASGDLVYRLHLDWSLLAAMQQHMMWISSRSNQQGARGSGLLNLIAGEPLSGIRSADLGLPLVARESAPP